MPAEFTSRKDPFITAQIEATQDQIAKTRMLLAQTAQDGAPSAKLQEIVGQIMFLEGRMSALRWCSREARHS